MDFSPATTEGSKITPIAPNTVGYTIQGRVTVTVGIVPTAVTGLTAITAEPAITSGGTVPMAYTGSGRTIIEDTTVTAGITPVAVTGVAPTFVGTVTVGIVPVAVTSVTVTTVGPSSVIVPENSTQGQRFAVVVVLSSGRSPEAVAPPK